MPKDVKEALGNSRKPDITHCRRSTMVYVARSCEYGSAKYERANYLRSTGGPMRADFERFRSYLRAMVSHVVETLDSMERHQANDPNLEDIEGMKRAAQAADTDVTPDCPVGASRLPHVGAALASGMMALEQAIAAGLLPADPGQPWRDATVLLDVTLEDEDQLVSGTALWNAKRGEMLNVSHGKEVWNGYATVDVNTGEGTAIQLDPRVEPEDLPEDPVDLSFVPPGLAVGRETEEAVKDTEANEAPSAQCRRCHGKLGSCECLHVK